ncbi:MAG: pyruvate kinase [Gammaproteobacteria bacterium]|nr:pyruvate kinase [Gammaproteobacteria bacterium]
MTMRSTKIVATIGPASDAHIDQLIALGVDVFRLNFSHGSQEEHRQRVKRIRRAAGRHRRFVAVLADMQGPKIRIRGFSSPSVELKNDAPFCIDASIDEHSGDATKVGTTWTRLSAQVSPGDKLLLGDGLIELDVTGIGPHRVECRVVSGGTLSANAGINKRGGGLSAPALTEKDSSDIEFACSLPVDYVAISFPRDAADMREARRLVHAFDTSCGLVAKLERAEAVDSTDAMRELILASDAVMVARGDLGIEIGDAALVAVQKRLIGLARSLNRSVITATQMMQSMIEHPKPTRAEVMDVANAVLDGTDAVMLSAETATGRYPQETVRSMVEIIEGAERHSQFNVASPIDPTCEAIDEAIARAATEVAANLDGVTAIACLTASGNTPQLMSRVASNPPIFAFADNPRTLARVALYRGVHPVLFDTRPIDHDEINQSAIDWLKRHHVVKSGERVVLTKGDYHNVQGGTNALKILQVS